MKVSDFDFALPESAIALHPVSPRDSARLLAVSKFFFDFTFRDLVGLLNKGDVLVFNDSRVIPARLFGKKGDAEIEILLHKPCPHPAPLPQGEGEEKMNPLLREMVAQAGEASLWRAFIRPGKKIKPGDVITITDGFTAIAHEKYDTGEVLLSFIVIPAKAGIQPALNPQDAFRAMLQKVGHMPLPPYIKRADDASDAAEYQTIYARHDGSVAAPTAGLHFTEPMMDALKAKGISLEYVTLHVGAGTFQPVKVEDTADHIMHSEWASIDDATAQRINAARAAGGKIVAVGTTALRILETVAANDGTLSAFAGDTDIFITPGYQFKIVDRLVTNFHLPKSTLFMLVCAFAGTHRMKAAYEHAKTSGYRFYSYGDACLLDRQG